MIREDDAAKRAALTKLYTATLKAEASDRVAALRTSRARQRESLTKMSYALGYARGYLRGRFR